MTGDRASDYDVLGFSLFGPAPIGVVHLKWSPGLTVLYGDNGAGKTTILRAISALLRGERTPGGRAYLHVRISESVEPFDFEDDSLTLDLVGGITEWVKDQNFTPDGSLFFEDRSMDFDDFEELLSSPGLESYIRATVGSLWARDANGAAVTDAVARHRVFSLCAEGGGRWAILGAIPYAAEPELIATVTEDVSGGSLVFDERDVHWNRPGDGSLIDAMRSATATLQDAALFMVSSPETWVPIPVGRIGSLDSDLMPDPVESSEVSVDTITQSFLLSGGAGAVDDLFSFIPANNGSGAMVGVSDDLSILLAQIGEKADSVIGGLLPHFPGLRLELQPPQSWLDGKFVSWVATDRPSGVDVPLEALSAAQSRWASLAVQTALWMGTPGGPHSVMLIDEPELALNSETSAQVADELAQLGDVVPVIVTSHSAAFLNLPEARLVHVERDLQGFTAVAPLATPATLSLLDLTAKLGLSPADALQLTRLWLVVEGRHDQALLQAVFGDELADLRVEILPTHGAHNVRSVIESQLLMLYTTAPVLVLLDMSGYGHLAEIWRNARTAANEGHEGVAKRMLMEAAETSDLSKVERAAVDLALAAIDTGHWRRLHLHVLSKPDIIYYLPAGAVVPGHGTWDEITAAYRQDRFEREGIKEWLKRRHAIGVSTKSISRTARNLDEVDQDLTDLLNVIRDLSR